MPGLAAQSSPTSSEASTWTAHSGMRVYPVQHTCLLQSHTHSSMMHDGLRPGVRSSAVASSLTRPPTHVSILAGRRLHILPAGHLQPRWWPLLFWWRATPRRRMAISGSWWQCLGSVQPRGHCHRLWEHRPGWPRWLGRPQGPWWRCCWLPAWPGPGLALGGVALRWRWPRPDWWPAAAAAAGWWSAL